MHRFFDKQARRFVSLAVLLLFTVPFGLSIAGCGHKTVAEYCSGDSGPLVGQPISIVLEQNLATIGESLNYGQIGAQLTASATDCRGTTVTVPKFVFATNDTSMKYADINSANGEVCAGSWNRNSGNGIPDYTICTPPSTTPPTNEWLITAEGSGVTSNAVPVFVHPTPTGIELTTPLSASDCSTTNDPTTNCCPYFQANTTNPAPAYDTSTLACVSQNQRVQLAAKVYANGATSGAANNITCQVGPINFTAQGSTNVVTIDQNAIATANQPGSATITATISNASTGANAGFFSTCPPASISLSVPGQPAGTTSIDVGLDNTQPLTATVLDTNGNTINGLSLEFNSTTPQTISASNGSAVASFPGSATITAVCLPSACNNSPPSQIGYLGNGQPITSNGITVNTAGTSGTVLYMASTQSLYVVPYDFTLTQQGAPIRLPFVPNSMVMTQDGTAVYFGSPQGLMALTTAANSVSGPTTSIPGTVLAVSPNDSYVVVTDPVRQTVSLVSSGAVVTSYGNFVGTSAQWSPDSQTVYITTNTNTLLTWSAFTSWRTTTTDETYQDVAVMVPSIGAYFSGGHGGTTDGRSYCANTTVTSNGGNGNAPTTTNVFAPLADQSAAVTDVLAATTDSKHILGASVNGGAPELSDITVVDPVQSSVPGSPIKACPLPPALVSPGYFQSSFTTHPLSNLTAVTAFSGVDPASNSALAFVTYTGSGGLLPYYVTASSAVNYLTLADGATTGSAPVAGVFSTDNFTFYAGTGGASGSSADDDVHLITLTYPSGSAPTVTDSGILSPNLPNASGSGYAPVNLIAQHPKKSQS